MEQLMKDVQSLMDLVNQHGTNDHKATLNFLVNDLMPRYVDALDKMNRAVDLLGTVRLASPNQ
jgi:hypothetical protein